MPSSAALTDQPRRSWEDRAGEGGRLGGFMGGVRVQEEPSCQDLPLGGARSLEPLESPLHWPDLMLGFFPSLRKTLFSREDGPAAAGGPTHHLNTLLI